MKISKQLHKASSQKKAEYDPNKTIPEARKWIKTLMDYAKKADRELATKKDPGMDMSYFVGFMKGYRDENWYDEFYG